MKSVTAAVAGRSGSLGRWSGGFAMTLGRSVMLATSYGAYFRWSVPAESG